MEREKEKTSSADGDEAENEGRGTRREEKEIGKRWSGGLVAVETIGFAWKEVGDDRFGSYDEENAGKMKRIEFEAKGERGWVIRTDAGGVAGRVRARSCERREK